MWDVEVVEWAHGLQVGDGPLWTAPAEDGDHPVQELANERTACSRTALLSVLPPRSW